jgi:methionyl-tRNA formyltransferase
MNRVVVFSPSRHSLQTTTVVELLAQAGVETSAVVVRRLLNPARLAAEFRRDGARLIKKIWRKLILRERAYSAAGVETLVDLRAARGVESRKVDDLKKKGIEIVWCDQFTDSHVVELLKKLAPRIGVFTGGGIIRPAVLDKFADGILNCHMGVLPPYRGMDVVEWPILERNFDQIGATVHFMDVGVDTGDVLRIVPIALEAADDIARLRMRFEPIMCRALAETCRDWFDGKLTRQSQSADAGRQYFIMHPRLYAAAEATLHRRLQK